MSHIDLSTPLDKYNDIDIEAMALTYAATALRVTAPSNDDLLGLFSPEWGLEANAFRKQEISAATLPTITATLSRYKDQHYYSIPIGHSTTNEISITALELGPYEFTSRSFPLISYGQHCWSGMYRKPGRTIGLKLMGNIVPCKLPVSDEKLARAIEAARAASQLDMSGRIFFYAPNSDENFVSAFVTAAQLNLVDQRTSTSLGNFEIKAQQ